MKRKLILFILVCLLVFANRFRIWSSRPPSKDTVYASFGDCYSLGVQAEPITNCYASLTAKALDDAYPDVNLVKLGIDGVTAADYADKIQNSFTQITESRHGPMARATLFIGVNDLKTIYEGCSDCTFKATYPQAVACSLKYKKNIQTCIDKILKFNPKCQLVLCTLPDPNNAGKGPCDPFKPLGVIKLFNKQILALGASNHLLVADLYTVMMGHPDWWVEGDIHPNNKGHAGIALAIETQFGIKPKLQTEQVKN